MNEKKKPLDILNSKKCVSFDTIKMLFQKKYIYDCFLHYLLELIVKLLRNLMTLMILEFYFFMFFVLFKYIGFYWNESGSWMVSRVVDRITFDFSFALSVVPCVETGNWVLLKCVKFFDWNWKLLWRGFLTLVKFDIFSAFSIFFWNSTKTASSRFQSYKLVQSQCSYQTQKVFKHSAQRWLDFNFHRGVFWELSEISEFSKFRQTKTFINFDKNLQKILFTQQNFNDWTNFDFFFLSRWVWNFA